MNKTIIIIFGILIAIAVAFIILKSTANAPHDGILITPTVSATPTLNITVISPKAGAAVGNPIVVTGQARVFENQFAYRLVNSHGTILVEGSAMSDAKDAGLFGNYTIKITVPTSDATKNLTIWVFEYSPKDGSITNLVKVPVLLK